MFSFCSCFPVWTTCTSNVSYIEMLNLPTCWWKYNLKMSRIFESGTSAFRASNARRKRGDRSLRANRWSTCSTPASSNLRCGNPSSSPSASAMWSCRAEGAEGIPPATSRPLAWWTWRRSGWLTWTNVTLLMRRIWTRHLQSPTWSRFSNRGL